MDDGSVNRVQMILNFISLVSEVTDAKPLYQSPDYIMDKFEQYINEIDKFEFPSVEFKLSDEEFINEYMDIWNKHSYTYTNFINILVFINRANWDSKTKPFKKVQIFKECIGDIKSVRNNPEHESGLHPGLNRWISESERLDWFKEDLIKTYREVSLDLLSI